MNIPKAFFCKNSFLLAAMWVVVCSFLFACEGSPNKKDRKQHKTALQILENPEYKAISYGGYRKKSREEQPSLEELKADLRILHAMGIRLLRTYNLKFEHTPNLLRGIREIHLEDPSFEMFVMLGTWIDCKGARTESPDHSKEDFINNSSEIQKAIKLANQYPEIIKIITVGNEAMVHWASSYFVSPKIILKWVNHLQGQKKEGRIPQDILITSSDNFASWGGGDSSYHSDELIQLIKAVDFLSVHSYPFHDSHYNPAFWKQPHDSLLVKSKEARINQSIDRAVLYTQKQIEDVKSYLKKNKLDKPIHLGETGWASISDRLYGIDGSAAADEYKQALFYEKIQRWAKQNNMKCFYFSAFDEPWKDPRRENATENNFGLFTVDGKAKFALWPLVDQGVFSGLSRTKKEIPISKTWEGNKSLLMKTVSEPK